MDGAMEEEANVKVVCRFRPFNGREIGLGIDGSQKLFKMDKESVEVVDRHDKDGKPLVFKLTRVFDMETIQEDVYEVVAARAMNDLFTGYNASVFAYGQTGSGKSWTMFGDRKNLKHRGLVPRCTESIFSTIKKGAGKGGNEFTIGCSYCEIYQEKITDLFRPRNNDLKLREDRKGGVFVEGLSTEYVSNVADVYQLLAIGDASKKKASTLMNQDSSRSHCCFTVRLQSHDKDGNMSEALLNLIDLAGSEKVAKTGAKGQSFEEARKINLSLTTLAKVIKALSEEHGGRVPYRESTLTRLLQNSLGGNSKTSMIVAASPHLDNIEETITSLRFAQSCSKVRNRVKQNMVLNPEQLQAMLDEARNEIRRAAGRGEVAEMKDFSMQTHEGEEDELWDFDDSQRVAQTKEEFDEKLYRKEQELEQERLNSEKLKVQLHAKEMELETAKSRVEYLEGRMGELEEKGERLKEVNLELTAKQGECDGLTKKVLKLEMDLADQRTEIANLETELAQERERGGRKDSLLSVQERAKNIMKGSSMRRSQSLMGGVSPPPLAAPDKKQSIMNFAGLKAKATQKKLDATSEKLKQLQEEKDALEETMVELDAELARLSMEVETCQATIKDKDKLLKMSEAANEGLEKRIQQQERMTTLVERSKEDVERRLEDQFAVVSKLQENERTFESVMKTMEDENKEAVEKKLELEKQVAELEAKLLRKESDNIRVPVVADSVLEQSRATQALGNMLGIFGFGFGEGEGEATPERPKSAAFSLNPLTIFSGREAEEEESAANTDGEGALSPVPPPKPKARPVSIKFW